MGHWIDPRTNPSPPYLGPARALARGKSELAELVAACKQGRLYEVEAWIASGRPLQMPPDRSRNERPSSTALAASLAAGNLDLVRLLLCNGYQTELEPRSPLNAALETRRWDLLGLLLDWGADPAVADLWRVLDSYDRAVLERFVAAGVDLTAGGAMASSLAGSTRNRPLYGFAKNHRNDDPRVQRALDVALGDAVKERNEKAISFCLWAGANPRRRVGEVTDEDQYDEDGMTAFERAVVAGAPEYLARLGFDLSADDLEELFAYASELPTLRALVAIRTPADWIPITRRFIERLALSLRFSTHRTGFWDVEQVFALGGRLGVLDRQLQSDLRRLLLSLSEREAQSLFRLLRDPTHMDREAFLDLIAHDKLAARYANWSWRSGVDRELLAELAERPSVPAVVRRMAKQRLTPVRRVIDHIRLEDAGVRRLLSREELYELVWSEPLLSLSRRFGLSDNGLRKRCKATNVPTPPRGYWQRLKGGRPTKRFPLRQLEVTPQLRRKNRHEAQPALPAAD